VHTLAVLLHSLRGQFFFTDNKMDRIHIVDWDKHQHYKDRNPPWIKLYNDLLDSYEFRRLQNDSKLLLIMLWMIRSKRNDDIPNDIKYIKDLSSFDGDINLQPLIEAGFIEIKNSDSSVIALCKQKAITEREIETEGEKEKNNVYLEIFESARKAYQGTKRGCQTEFDDFTRKHKDWKEVLPLLEAVIKRQIDNREKLKFARQTDRNVFIPPWKNFKTWLYNRCWEEESIASAAKKSTRLCSCGCGKEAHIQVSSKWYASTECRKKVEGW
jgi:hypothetical protein